MKPSKLALHFYSKHSNLEGKQLEYLEPLLPDMSDQKKQIKKMTTTEKSFLRASYAISLPRAKARIIGDWGNVSKAMDLICG